MPHHTTNRKHVSRTERERWMATFERLVLAQVPQHAGKIEWGPASFYFNSGYAVTEAAERYVNSLEQV